LTTEQTRGRRIWREPLVHFFALGALLFALYGWVNPGVDDADRVIVLDDSQVANLVTSFERTWRRSPTAGELTGLVDAYVREEILYREGLAMGLEQGDPIVRRRVAQKLSFLAEDLATPSPPTEAELAAWLANHPDEYRIEPRYTLRQIYFDPSRAGSGLQERIETALASLRDDDLPAGEATMLPAMLTEASTSEVARVFGTVFAEAIAELPVGQWQGPVQSGYGLHLVLVSAREPGRLPTLEEVHGAVERDFLNARTEEANAAFYSALRDQYTVRMPGADEPPTDGEPR
jgi:PPIC-type PPIASE domain